MEVARRCLNRQFNCPPRGRTKEMVMTVKQIFVGFLEAFFGKPPLSPRTNYSCSEDNKITIPKFLLSSTVETFKVELPKYIERWKQEAAYVTAVVDRMNADAEKIRALAEANLTAAINPLERELARREWVSANDDATNIEQDAWRERNSIPTLKTFIAKELERKLQHDERQTILDASVVIHRTREHHPWFHDEWEERRIVAYASSVYLMQVNKIGEDYPPTAKWITDSIEQMTSDELRAIKTYRSKHPEQQQIAS
jgi:hypothetical protein